MGIGGMFAAYEFAVVGVADGGNLNDLGDTGLGAGIEKRDRHRPVYTVEISPAVCPQDSDTVDHRVDTVQAA